MGYKVYQKKNNAFCGEVFEHNSSPSTSSTTRAHSHFWAGTIHPAGLLPVGRVIGSGSFGEVKVSTYKGSPVAIKTVSASNDHEETLVAKEIFALERAECGGNHQHVVPFRGWFQETGILKAVLVFGYAPHGSLTQWHKKQFQSGPLPTEDLLCQIMTQILSAVSFLHKKSILHRDMKPDNIVVCKENSGVPHVWIIDFGLSKTCLVGTMYVGSIVGTPITMSPELLRLETNGAVDGPQTVVFAAGCVARGLATGKGNYPIFDDPSVRKKRREGFTEWKNKNPTAKPKEIETFRRRVCFESLQKFSENLLNLKTAKIWYNTLIEKWIQIGAGAWQSTDTPTMRLCHDMLNATHWMRPTVEEALEIFTKRSEELRQAIP